MARVLIEASPADEDAGMLPRNNLPEAILYARVLSSREELTEDALRDLALLQDNVSAAAKALSEAVVQYGLTVSDPKPVAVGSLLF